MTQRLKVSTFYIASLPNLNETEEEYRRTVTVDGKPASVCRLSAPFLPPLTNEYILAGGARYGWSRAVQLPE